MHFFFFPLSGIGLFFLEIYVPYLGEAVQKALAGDVTSITLLGIAAIVCFILLILVVEFTGWMVSVTKRFFLLVAIIISNLLFFLAIFEKAPSAEGSAVATAAAIIGSFFAVAALVISLISMKKHLFKSKEEKIAELKSNMKNSLKTLVAEKYEEELEGKHFESPEDEDLYSKISIPKTVEKKHFDPMVILVHFQDTSQFAMLSYMVCVEFAVIGPLPASFESELFGLIAFAVFLIASMIFVKTAYRSYTRGMKYLFMSLFAGFAIAAITSIAWLGTPFETLFSLDFFKTSAVFALMAGVAISLFIGSKKIGAP